MTFAQLIPYLQNGAYGTFKLDEYTLCITIDSDDPSATILWGYARWSPADVSYHYGFNLTRELLTTDKWEVVTQADIDRDYPPETKRPRLRYRYQ